MENIFTINTNFHFPAGNEGLWLIAMEKRKENFYLQQLVAHTFLADLYIAIEYIFIQNRC